jgi:hypothetical protein
MNTVQDLIDLARMELSDPLFSAVDTYSFYKDEELIEWINNAQQEFSAKTRCLPDNDVTVSLIDGTAEYSYGDGIVEIRAGKLASTGARVKPDSFENIERRYVMNSPAIIAYGGWEAEEGTPTHMVIDMEASVLRMYPIPAANDTLNLYAFKLSNTVDDGADTLEIPEQHRYGLIYRVMSQAFNKLDTSNIQDSAKGLEFSQRWESFLNDATAFYARRFKRV